MTSSRLVGRWLANAGSSKLAVRLRPVSRVLRVSGRWNGLLEMLAGRARLVISLRPVSRLLMKCPMSWLVPVDWLIGRAEA